MPRYFAFLRGINLGSHIVSNAHLVELFAGAGVKGAEPFIASGNVSFESTATAAALEKKVAAHLEKKLGYPVATYIRSQKELAKIAAVAPFKPARVKSAVVMTIAFLAKKVTPAQQEVIAGLCDAESDLYAEGREIYWLCQVKQSESKLFRIPFEKRLGAQCSWRNRNTVDRLLAKYGT